MGELEWCWICEWLRATKGEVMRMMQVASADSDTMSAGRKLALGSPTRSLLRTECPPSTPEEVRRPNEGGRGFIVAEVGGISHKYSMKKVLPRRQKLRYIICIHKEGTPQEITNAHYNSVVLPRTLFPNLALQSDAPTSSAVPIRSTREGTQLPTCNGHPPLEPSIHCAATS
jgi:hypothetical protein